MMKHLSGVVGKFFISILCGFFFVTQAATGQDAKVIFYNHGSTWAGGLPGSNHGIFYGCIYDGAIRLNCFREQKIFSQIKNNRFAVYHLLPGLHVFSASYGKHPAQRSQLKIELVAGKAYYLRAQSESRGVVEIEWEYGRLDEVNCMTAEQETGKAKALTDKFFSSDGRAALTASQTIPPCAAPNP